MQSCFKRLLNVIMTEECTITENNRKLQPKLAAMLYKHYRRFVFDAMKMAFICGFVPFYLTTHQHIKIPMVVTPGCFSWSVESITNSSKKRKLSDSNKCAQYVVHVHHGSLKDEDVHVINFSTPVVANEGEVCYPIRALYQQYLQLQHVQKIIQQANVWNKEKHVAITEHFDLKDQTTSGIELLDEVRRYTLTGQSGIAPIVRMRRANGADGESTMLHSINDANMHWLQQTFEGSDQSAAAKFHLLPANMNISELGTITVGQELEHLMSHYRRSVHDFFDMPNTDQAAGHSNAIIGAQLSRQQYNQVLATNKFIENLLEQCYRLQFNLKEEHNVQVLLNPQSRLEIGSFADIKQVSDIENFLTDKDKQRIKNLFLK